MAITEKHVLADVTTIQHVGQASPAHMYNALLHVLDLHVPKVTRSGFDGSITSAQCTHCGTSYPCETAATIRNSVGA